MTIAAPDFEEIKSSRLQVQRAENEMAEKQSQKAVKRSLFPSIVSSGLDFLGNSILQDKAQHYYKENQQKLFSLQQEAQKNAASNEVEGLRRAGLSTALAQGASGMSIATASSPSASSRATAPAPEFGKVGSENAVMKQEQRLMQSEIDVKAAQASLINSQKMGQDLANENQLGENYVVQQTWDNLLDSQINLAQSAGDTAIAEALSSLKESVHPYLNAGAYQFLQGVLSTQGDYAKAIDARVTSFLNAEVNAIRASSKGIISELAIAPLLKNNEIRAHIGEMAAIQVKMLADAENAKALLPAYNKALDRVLAEIRLADVKADEIHNSDLQTAIANDDWGRAGSIITEDAVKIGLNAVGFYMGGRGLRAAGGRAVAPAVAPAAAPVAAQGAYKYKPQIVGETKKANRPATQEEWREALKPYVTRSNPSFSRPPVTEIKHGKNGQTYVKYQGQKGWHPYKEHRDYWIQILIFRMKI